MTRCFFFNIVSVWLANQSIHSRAGARFYGYIIIITNGICGTHAAMSGTMILPLLPPGVPGRAPYTPLPLPLCPLPLCPLPLDGGTGARGSRPSAAEGPRRRRRLVIGSGGVIYRERERIEKGCQREGEKKKKKKKTLIEYRPLAFYFLTWTQMLLTCGDATK
jgi:hypothetical protein